MIDISSSQYPSLVTTLYQYAKRYARRQDEVDDLIQDMFLTAIESGREIQTDQFLLWGKGFIRNHSAFVARGEGRRRIRELNFSSKADSATIEVRVPDQFVEALVPSLRILCRLINSGLNRQEILYALDIPDTALRQRLTALRKEWNTFLIENPKETEIERDPVSLLETGLLRQSLIKCMRGHRNNLAEGVKIIGSHDPDGNLLIFSGKLAHKNRGDGNSK